MLKKHLLILASMVAFVLFFQFGCDDKSLTETDFFDEESDKISDIPDCNVILPSKSDDVVQNEKNNLYFSNRISADPCMASDSAQLPTNYSLEICWSNRDSGILQISYTLAITSNVLITLSDQSGGIVKTIAEGRQSAGAYIAAWTATSKGIFNVAMNAAEFHQNYWFEVK